jgi:DNA repair exonuclease SbcCD ATPase subunit
MKINKRDEFLKKNGLYIPKSMIPQLGNKAPYIKLVPKEIYSEEYPDELLSENDKVINGVDCKVYYFEKIFSDILKKVKGIDSKARGDNDGIRLKAEIKKLKELHEEEMINLLEPYKQEISSLVTDKKQIDDKIKDLEQAHSEHQDLQTEHSKCDLLSQKIETLKRRNKELADQSDSKLRDYATKNQQHETTLKSINELTKDAVIKLGIKVSVTEDDRFFEDAFKQICKRLYELNNDVSTLINQPE